MVVELAFARLSSVVNFIYGYLLSLSSSAGVSIGKSGGMSCEPVVSVTTSHQPPGRYDTTMVPDTLAIEQRERSDVCTDKSWYYASCHINRKY
jgi:hypothetical protein